MKLVILAGGLGTRLSEETGSRPKPMVEIGGKPILWHIMKYYSHYGINDFIICLGYKGYIIKEYFANYHLHQSDLTLDFRENKTTLHDNKSEPWKITLVDTGDETQTGGRLKRVEKYLADDDEFCFTYGDGLSNVDIKKLLNFHRDHKKICTMTAVLPPGRFGALKFNDGKVSGFQEKPQGDNSWINGGFFVLTKNVFSYLKEDATIWEREPLERLVADNQMQAYLHNDFWHPMDTLRDKNQLESFWQSGRAPWKLWK